VVPGDFDHDGRLDLLVMTEVESGGWWGGKAEALDMTIHLGGGVGGGIRELGCLRATLS
jgi:integrin alpha FG-GAP repeat containing protein 1